MNIDLQGTKDSTCTTRSKEFRSTCESAKRPPIKSWRNWLLRRLATGWINFESGPWPVGPTIQCDPKPWIGTRIWRKRWPKWPITATRGLAISSCSRPIPDSLLCCHSNRIARSALIASLCSWKCQHTALKICFCVPKTAKYGLKTHQKWS